MIRIANVKHRVFSSLTALMRSRRDANQSPIAQSTMMTQMLQMTKTLMRRKAEGHATTLRQLHKICDLSQPQALTIVAELEKAGIVSIDRNASDAFESVIELTDDADQFLHAGNEVSPPQGDDQAPTPKLDQGGKAAA